MSTFRHAGVVLAAGASSRMGKPKALLKTRSGDPLAAVQAELLNSAGCDRVVVVLGADYERIAPQLKNLGLVRNADWETGRISSIRAGLRVLLPFDGAFILPVDTVGIRPETLTRMRKTAETQSPPAVRPLYRGKAGNLLWISYELADKLHLLEAEPANAPERLDTAVDPYALHIDVDDPAILHNVNTPEEWEKIRSSC